MTAPALQAHKKGSSYNIRTVLILSACLTSTADAATEIKWVDPRFIDESEFQRIGEFFGGEEQRGRRLIVRTDAESRTGFYFVIALTTRATDLPGETVLAVELISSESPEPRSFRFPLPAERPPRREIFIGLTGRDQPKFNARIMAWRIVIETGSGDVIASKNSYLWRYPQDARPDSGNR